MFHVRVEASNRGTTSTNYRLGWVKMPLQLLFLQNTGHTQDFSNANLLEWYRRVCACVRIHTHTHTHKHTHTHMVTLHCSHSDAPLLTRTHHAHTYTSSIAYLVNREPREHMLTQLFVVFWYTSLVNWSEPCKSNSKLNVLWLILVKTL